MGCPSLQKEQGYILRGSVLFRKQGTWRSSSQMHLLIVLPERTSETEHLSPGAVLSRAVAHGLSWGCGGSLGAAGVRWIFPGYSLATRCHARTTRTACAPVLQLPAHGLTRPWCLLVACRCHVGVVSSHVPQQRLRCTCRKNVCATPAPHHHLPPTTKSTENPSVSNM